MKCVVLGSSGFIGSRIAKSLTAKGVECFQINSNNCDLRNVTQSEKTLGPIIKDAVVIFSAGRHRMRSDSFQTMCENIKILDNLVGIFEKAPPKKMIFLSSVEVYGLARELPITEVTDIEPETLYGIGKFAAELVLKKWKRKSASSLAILRLPGVYGPGDTSGGLIFHIVKSITDGNSFSLYGDGEELRDYVFVDDVARIVLELAKLDFEELTLNIATGKSSSLTEILETAKAVFGECVTERKERKQAAQDICFDISQLQHSLPGIQMTDLRKGFQLTNKALIAQGKGNV